MDIIKPFKFLTFYFKMNNSEIQAKYERRMNKTTKDM